MDKRTASFPTVGGSTLLVTFAVLCLTVFALLSLSTARAGRALAEQSARSVAAYYEADRAAEAVLSQLRAGEQPDGVTEQDGIYSYTCIQSDTRALEVSVRLSPEGFTVLRWQSVSTLDWAADSSLDLWDGPSN